MKVTIVKDLNVKAGVYDTQDGNDGVELSVDFWLPGDEPPTTPPVDPPPVEPPVDPPVTPPVTPPPVVPPPVGPQINGEVLSMGMAVAYIDYTTPPAGLTVKSIAWEFGDTYMSSQASGQHLYAASGVYNVVQTVTFSDGTTGEYTHQVTIALTPRIVVDGRSILYHLDSNEFVERVNWAFGDGEIAGDGLADGRHPYAADGTYTVTGSVTYVGLPNRIDPFGPVTVTVP